jgi:hypothetical protein
MRKRPRSRRARRACSADPWHWPFVPRAPGASFGSSRRAGSERAHCCRRGSLRARRCRARESAVSRCSGGRSARRRPRGTWKTTLSRRRSPRATSSRSPPSASRRPTGAAPAPSHRAVLPHRGRGSPVLARRRRPAAARSRSRGSVAALACPVEIPAIGGQALSRGNCQIAYRTQSQSVRFLFLRVCGRQPTRNDRTQQVNSNQQCAERRSLLARQPVPPSARHAKAFGDSRSRGSTYRGVSIRRPRAELVWICCS